MSILEVGDDGMLHVPAEMLGGAKPHTAFILEALGEVVVLRPAGDAKPFWESATTEERIEAFEKWANTPRPGVPDVDIEFLSREHIYD
jgi:hypothetical protein